MIRAWYPCPVPAEPRLLLDCTRTAIHGGTSGVQRVVRNLVMHTPSAAALHGIRAKPVAWTGQRYQRLYSPLPLQTPPWLTTLRRLRSPLPKPRGGAGPSTAAPQPIKPWQQWLITRPLSRGDLAAPSADDTLLLLDTPWNLPHALDYAAQCPARVGLLLHDVIPLSHPETCAPQVPAQFMAFLERSLGVVDFVLCVSHATQAALRERCPKAPPAHVIRLGHDMDPPNASDLIRSTMRRFFEEDSYTFLMLGTIEPRKNHRVVLDAMAQLDTPPRLLILGGVGWAEPQTVQRIQRLAGEGKLMHLADANDAELRFALEHATALLAPSLVEGFGLPLVEALAHRLPVIASDIPAHHEAAGEHALYFPPQDADALVRHLSAPPPRLASPPASVGWRETAAQLIRCVMERSP